MEFENLINQRKDKKMYKCNDKFAKVFDETYSKSRILNEALNQSRIEETGLNIPNLQEVTKIDGKWVIVMDYIDGKTLEQLIQENPNETEKYLNIFVKTQIEIHSKRSPLLSVLSDKMTKKINKTDLSDTIKFDLNSRIAGFKKHYKVLHGDYQLSNVIISKDNKIYVVDWSHATQGNASADVALSYLLFIINNKNELAEKYLDLYCQKTNTSKQYVLSFVPVVAGSQILNCKPEQKDMLKKFANVVDYQ